MIVQRQRHAERVAGFSVCKDEHLDVAHDVTRGLYIGSMAASAFIGGPLAPLFLVATFTTGTIYGSMSNRLMERSGAQISGQSVSEPVEVDGFTVAFEVFERMVPVLMMGL